MGKKSEYTSFADYCCHGVQFYPFIRILVLQFPCLNFVGCFEYCFYIKYFLFKSIIIIFLNIQLFLQWMHFALLPVSWFLLHCTLYFSLIKSF